MISRVGNNGYNQNYVTSTSGNRPAARPASTNQTFWNTPSIFATNHNGHSHVANRTSGDNFQRAAVVNNSSQNNVVYRSNSNLNDYHRLASRPVASRFPVYASSPVDYSSRVNEVNGMDNIGEQGSVQGQDGVEGPNQGDDTPIGQQTLSDSDKKIVDAAMKGFPAELRAVAIEHFAAMGATSSSSSATSSTDDKKDSSGIFNKKNDFSNDEKAKIEKLANFLKEYKEAFGSQGNISKDQYLNNVKQLFANKMQAEGKPFIDPASGIFDPESKDYAAIATANRDVKATGFELPANNNTNNNGNNGELADYILKNENDSKYKGLSESQKKDKLIQDYEASKK